MHNCSQQMVKEDSRSRGRGHLQAPGPVKRGRHRQRAKVFSGRTLREEPPALEEGLCRGAPPGRVWAHVHPDAAHLLLAGTGERKTRDALNIQTRRSGARRVGRDGGFKGAGATAAPPPWWAGWYLSKTSALRRHGHERGASRRSGHALIGIVSCPRTRSSRPHQT